MKKFKVSFLTKHESYNGFEHSDGWYEVVVSARNSLSAKNKAIKVWEKSYNNSYWISDTYIVDEDD